MIDVLKTIENAVVYLILGLFIGISQSAGVGGGPVINITLMFALGYSVKTSMAMAYVFILGGTVSSFLSNVGQRDPDTHRFFMDYDLILLTMPMMLTGSIFGTLSNHFFSELFLTIFFTILLSYLSYSFYFKFKNPSVAPTPKPTIVSISIDINADTRAQQLRDKDLQLFPVEKFKTFLQIFGYSLFLLFCMGGSKFNSIIGLQKCGIGFYLIFLLQGILSYFFTKSIGKKINEFDKEKEAAGISDKKDDEKITNESCRKTMLIGFFAGTLGATLGLGGAIVLVPIWISNGISDRTAVYSTAPLIFVSAFMSMLIAAFSQLYESILIVFFNLLFGFISSRYIRSLIKYLTQKYHLRQVVFLLLFIIMLVSLLLMVPFQITKYLASPQQFMAFGTPC